MNAEQAEVCESNIKYCEFLPIMETEEDGDPDYYYDDYINENTFKMELIYTKERRIIQQIKVFRKILIDFLHHPVKTVKAEIRNELIDDIETFRKEFPELQVDNYRTFTSSRTLKIHPELGKSKIGLLFRIWKSSSKSKTEAKTPKTLGNHQQSQLTGNLSSDIVVNIF